ncbi:serine O-acetyltransferase [Algoriphagus zhangzhouensis]|uniref:Serine acetyltransferase n=1 Tax=Algoriphagus zhangzhouensis TaxID=1073327 RepID=A0A1M7ZGS7_9BACT|nr:serine O-acetyltransferase [Algoriphagus zhangzhouensis]TDY44689.1 serine O-acetyltransferase [Algoriphagus zhangzhouensis]SHO64019.1 serine O-acetyltransferase [Algoriphagus zhangzhouensis]
MDSFIDKVYHAHRQCSDCPSPKVIQAFFEELLGTIFPEYSVNRLKEREEIAERFSELEFTLAAILERNPQLHEREGKVIAHDFFQSLEKIFDWIHWDVDAMFEGDPAAKSKTEIIRSYPGFFAIAAYRIAHELHIQGVQLIPRMITEFAHSRTGIDIHPGATIGKHFCIDHGTGVVIGETTIIGENVKVYQGVTLGALSVDKADADIKRHPTIEDHVIIYAGATILGGKTVIGKNSVIGGNVWLTKSVDPGSKVYYQSQMYHADSEVTDRYVFKNDQSEAS